MNLTNSKRILILASALIAIGLVLLILSGLDMLSYYRGESYGQEDAAAAALFRGDALDAKELFSELITERELEAERRADEAMEKRVNDRIEGFSKELLILVNPWNNVPEDYSPNLGEVENYLVDRRCVNALGAMLEDCREAGNLPVICSAYRTNDYQEMLYRNKILRVLAAGVQPMDAPAVAAQSVAVPGTSEHELGLAVDIIDELYTNLDRWQEHTSVQQWLMENCWKYGFILRYPNECSETTGIIYEPWHYRYVGLKTAKAVTESGLCFEDYLKTLE
ncbi:MAG: M15 family metallopeptidase [Candidatus Limivicinus sp.]